MEWSRHFSRRLLTGLLLLVGGIVLAYFAWAMFHRTGFGDRDRTDILGGLARGREASGVETVRAADVPVAMLADYYENTIEHVPPRDPGNAMRRRERFYRAPPDPFKSMRVRLTGSETDKMLNERL